MRRGSWRLQRRTFLRGAGAALALPLLDAMETMAGAAEAVAANASGAAAPVRFAALFFPNGVFRPSWIPKK